MKYKELIQFDPINQVVKFSQLDDSEYKKMLVKTFVYSKSYQETIIPLICKNLDYTISDEHFGIQIVGNYGTGKSHLMSLFSIIAEDANYLQYVEQSDIREHFKSIAGKYKVCRFELGSTEELWTIITDQLDRYLENLGVSYSISDDNAKDFYYDKLQRMLSAFETQYPDHGLMLVIDEMLAYLKGRSDSAALNRDLQVLQALGQLCDRSKFRMVFGVQEMIYTAPEFQYASNMLQKVADRYIDITITKQDVKFVVQHRLLRKSAQQKQIIRDHLQKFTTFFPEVGKYLEEYVDIFPVNPSYFDNFQMIRIGKSQREILKTLSAKFSRMMDQDVPINEPGLICYDDYWNDLVGNASMKADPDMQRVSEVMSIVHQKIEDGFTGGRAPKKALAHRIVNACAIKILQQDLTKTNGVTAETLVDDLCYLDATAIDHDMLRDIIDMVSKNIITVTLGQYFDYNDTNLEYHIRIQGGVNYEQKIKDFASTMPTSTKDALFFRYLEENLPIEKDYYVSGFTIWSHELQWLSHKTYRNGYIFMGNRDKRSTTQPEQNFYLYFLPIFGSSTIGNEEDSVYVCMDKFSEDFKSKITLWSAARSLHDSSDSTQKPQYKTIENRYQQDLRKLFRQEFFQNASITYLGDEQSLATFNTPTANVMDVINQIASLALENHFNKRQDYPKFTLLQQPMTSTNRDNLIKFALGVIASGADNRNGQAILAGLGLYDNNKLSTQNSIYAISLHQMLEDKNGQVINQNEILTQFYGNEYHSKDYDIEADLEYIVLAAMAQLGEIEICYPQGLSINATNINNIINYHGSDFVGFSYIRPPKGANMAAIRELFLSIVEEDLSKKLSDPATYSKLIHSAGEIAKRCAKMIHDLGGSDFGFGGKPLFDKAHIDEFTRHLTGLKGLCDQTQNYTSEPKIKNLRWSVEEIQSQTKHIASLEMLEKLKESLDGLRTKYNYLNQARQYIVNNDALMSQIDKAIHFIDGGQDITTEKVREHYSQLLTDAQDKYADWYLQQYVSHHLDPFQLKDKNSIANSEEKQVCDILRDAKWCSAISYTEWLHRMNQLQIGVDLTKEMVLSTPYHNFDPREYANMPLLPKLADLRTELEDIYTNYESTAHETLGDPGVKKNISVLEPDEKKIIELFEDNKIRLDVAHAASISTILDKLHHGFVTVYITSADIQAIFNHPMTPGNAIDAFKKYIENKLSGKDNSTARIIFK